MDSESDYQAGGQDGAGGEATKCVTVCITMDIAFVK
jgi:hypothetical protein